MRIFCCSNSDECAATPARSNVSIRHADFLLFEQRSDCAANAERVGFNPPCGFFVVRTAGLHRHSARSLLFQSAMRIFCCSNLAHVEERKERLSGFNPPCGFFVVRTPAPETPGSAPGTFQSAMRIYCCSNASRPPLRWRFARVSIRHADFLLFERRASGAMKRSNSEVSIRHADFLLFERLDEHVDHPLQDVSIRHADFLLFELLPPRRRPIPGRRRFNPPCGFFVVRTARFLCHRHRRQVSIRHADFLLFERQSLDYAPFVEYGFQSAMRIFCCSNYLERGAIQGDIRMFQSAMRIFCCSNRAQADHRRWEMAEFQSAMRIFCCSNARLLGRVGNRRVRFNPPCGFFVVRTRTTDSSINPALLFQSAMRIFCCSNLRVVAPLRGGRGGFNPPCGFFVVRTPNGEQFDGATHTQFQSAMRIFCCSNLMTSFVAIAALTVSIRHADFLLFEQRLNPVVGVDRSRVSIRHADFLLFELSAGSARSSI